MGIKTVLGFSLKPVTLDPDGLSAPPDPSELAPPSGHPADDENTGEAADTQDAEAAEIPAEDADDIYAGLLEEDAPPVSEPAPSAASPRLGATRRELEPTPALAAALAEASEPPASDAYDDDMDADAAYADDGSAPGGAFDHEPAHDDADAPFSADAHEGNDAAEDVADSAHDDAPAGAGMFPLGATRLEGLPAAAALHAAAAADDAADSVGPAIAPVHERAATSRIGRVKNIVVAAAAFSSIPLAGTVIWLLMNQAQPAASEPAPATAAPHAAAPAAPPAHPTATAPAPAAESAHHEPKHAGDEEHHDGATSGEPHAQAALATPHGEAPHGEAPHGKEEKVDGKAEKLAEMPASEGHSTTQTPAAHTESETPAASGACKLERMARRLARDVSPRVPLEAERLPSGEILVGYAGMNADAHGLTLDPASLRARESLKEAGSEQVLGVVPWSTEADAPFVVDREGEGGVWRTLPGASGLALQYSAKQLSLVHRGGRHASPLWALAAETVSRPAVVAAGQQRYALALREGDERGQVRYGWLDARSQRQAPLLTLPLGAAEVGVPSLAVRDHDLVIASALRDRDDGPWRIELWRAEGKAPPSRVRLPSLRQSLDDQIAPRVVALSAGRWALQWTTGRAGERRVDVLVLDGELNPIAEPLALSKRRTSAGAGLLIAAPPGLVSLYLVQSGERYELWAQALAC